jgi:hypothetical protein
MAKLGKRNIEVQSNIDYTQRISFDVDINVSKDGEFYFTLNDEQKETLYKLGVDISSTFNHRTHKIGTFYSNSLDLLISNFKALVSDAVSAETLEDKYVIIYKISTACSYTTSEGIPVPNGTYAKKEEKDKDGYCKWYKGESDGENGFGFNIYAAVYKKQVLKFRNGKVKTFYWALNYKQSETELGEFGKRLNHFKLETADIRDPYSPNSHSSMYGRSEIDYNEANAKFFHDLLVSVCKLNEQIKHFVNEPDKMQMVINSSMKLLQ